MLDAKSVALSVARRLERPRAPWLLAGVAVALSLFSIGPHLAFDDAILGLGARGEPPIAGLVQSQFDLFTFTTGRPDENRALIDRGILLPWWTTPDLKIAFWRPLSSLTHRVDFRLWPDSAELMHAHNVAWFAAMLFAVIALYRRVETSPLVLGAAAFVYALDDAHGPAVSWISNRNALIATAFGALAVAAHVTWRRDGRRSAAVAAPLLFLTGFAAGEFAVGALAYVLAYAACVDRSRPLERLGSLAPGAVVFVVWRAVHGAGGYGAIGSGAYVDPLRDPVRFLGALPEKLLVLLHGQLGAPPSDLAFFGPPEDRPLFIVLATITAAAAAVAFAPILRRDAVARFWALGAVLAAVPVSASFPSDRLLLFVGIGAAGLLGRLFASALDTSAEARPRRVRALITVGFAVVHGLVAPLLLPLRSAQMTVAGRIQEESARVFDTVADLPEKTVVVVNAPIDILASYVQAERAWEGRPLAGAFYWLASASSPIELRRLDERTLLVSPKEGFLHTPLERHYRGDTRSLPAGTSVLLDEMTATVVETLPDGRPGTVRFTFGAPLDSENIVFFAWRNGRYEHIDPPATGEARTFPREDFGKILLSSLIE